MESKYEEGTVHPDFLFLRSKLEEINENNITSFESVDTIYLVYSALLEHKSEPYISVGYKIISDKLVKVSLILQETPSSISKHLGCVLILSAFIVKTEDWCNLDDVSNFNICNFIINVITEYYNEEFTTVPSIDDDNMSYESYPKYLCIEHEKYLSSRDRNKAVNLRNCNFKKITLTDSNSEFSSEIFFLKAITIQNLESISSVIGYNLTKKLINLIENCEATDESKKDIFYKLYIFNAMICFYRCSGSFLNDALTFKLPRGRYLIEKGTLTISKYILKDFKVHRERRKILKFSQYGVLDIVNSISMILWFKIYVMKISVIVNSTVKEIVEDNPIEEMIQVNKEYQKLELLNIHSELLTDIISSFIESNCLNNRGDDDDLSVFEREIENILIKTTLEVVHTTFSIPLNYRNYFKIHFHTNEVINNQILNLLFYFGHLVKLTSKGIIIYSDNDIIVYILKTYLNVVYSITRFGDSSTKRMFILSLSNGISLNFVTELDKIRRNLEYFINDRNILVNLTQYREPVFTFAKYSLYLATRIKHILFQNLTSKNIYGEKSNSYFNDKCIQVFYYEIASLVYTLNFVNILIKDKKDETKNMRSENIHTLSDMIIMKIFTCVELEEMINVVNIAYNNYGDKEQLFNKNLAFEFKFIHNYLSKYVSSKKNNKS